MIEVSNSTKYRVVLKNQEDGTEESWTSFFLVGFVFGKNGDVEISSSVQYRGVGSTAFALMVLDAIEKYINAEDGWEKSEGRKN